MCCLLSVNNQSVKFNVKRHSGVMEQSARVKRLIPADSIDYKRSGRSHPDIPRWFVDCCFEASSLAFWLSPSCFFFVARSDRIWMRGRS